MPVCQYDFKYTDVNGFLAVSRALENTGVSAYDGAAATIVEKAYLTAAATIGRFIFFLPEEEKKTIRLIFTWNHPNNMIAFIL